MATSPKNTNTPGQQPLKKMPVTAYPAQLARQQISLDWRPEGIERYPLAERWREQMSELTGIGVNPDRVKPSTE